MTPAAQVTNVHRLVDEWIRDHPWEPEYRHVVNELERALGRQLTEWSDKTASGVAESM